MPNKTVTAKRHGQKGEELLEFGFALVPFIAMMAVLFDVGWGVFAKATVQRAARVGVEQGVSMTSSQLAQGACLTDTVKSIVQQNSLGFLTGSSGLALIKVNYFQPPAAGSGGSVTDVSSSANANLPGNIMQVSVNNYSLTPLIPRIFVPNVGVDRGATGLTVYAAGVIQLTINTPCVGTAP